MSIFDDKNDFEFECFRRQNRLIEILSQMNQVDAIILLVRLHNRLQIKEPKWLAFHKDLLRDADKS